MTPNLVRFAELYNRKRDLDAEVKRVEEEMKVLEGPLMEQFASDGISSVKIGGQTVYLHSQLWAKLIVRDGEDRDAAKERALNALKAAQLEDFVEESYNSNRLSAYLRELKQQGKPMPEEFEGAIEGITQFSLRARKVD